MAEPNGRNRGRAEKKKEKRKRKRKRKKERKRKKRKEVLTNIVTVEEVIGAFDIGFVETVCGGDTGTSGSSSGVDGFSTWGSSGESWSCES